MGPFIFTVLCYIGVAFIILCVCDINKTNKKRKEFLSRFDLTADEILLFTAYNSITNTKTKKTLRFGDDLFENPTGLRDVLDSMEGNYTEYKAVRCEDGKIKVSTILPSSSSKYFEKLMTFYLEGLTPETDLDWLTFFNFCKDGGPEMEQEIDLALKESKIRRDLDWLEATERYNKQEKLIKNRISVL